MPWSAQDIEQLLGRAFRPPQQKRVIMYQLVLAGTSDVFINNVSEDKGVMHRALMNVPLALRTSCLLSFCAVSLTLAVFAERVFDGDIDVIEISDSEADKSGSEKSGTEDGDEDGGMDKVFNRLILAGQDANKLVQRDTGNKVNCSCTIEL